MPIPIAITGLGAISAAGVDAAALRNALAAGRCGVVHSPNPALPLSRSIPVGHVQRQAERTPRTLALAHTAGREALHHAGLWGQADIGLALGSCTGGMGSGEALYLSGAPQSSGGYRQQSVGRCVVSLAQRLGLRGPLSAHAEACASAACALAEACTWIRLGLLPAVLLVGSDSLTRLTMAGFNSLGVLDPLGCRPFAVDRAGMSLGEGACALLLEHPDAARKRGAQIYASILGWGLRADAFHATAPKPDGEHLELSIREAMADAGIGSAQIGFVAAHGTGTRDNDAVEALVLARMFGTVPTASHKRNLGHTLGAAAAFGLFAAVEAVNSQRVLANAALDGQAMMTGIEVVSSTRPAAVPCALVTCLAFGGVNAAVVVGGAERCA